CGKLRKVAERIGKLRIDTTFVMMNAGWGMMDAVRLGASGYGIHTLGVLEPLHRYNPCNHWRFLRSEPLHLPLQAVTGRYILRFQRFRTGESELARQWRKFPSPGGRDFCPDIADIADRSMFARVL